MSKMEELCGKRSPHSQKSASPGLTNMVSSSSPVIITTEMVVKQFVETVEQEASVKIQVRNIVSKMSSEQQSVTLLQNRIQQLMQQGGDTKTVANQLARYKEQLVHTRQSGQVTYANLKTLRENVVIQLNTVIKLLGNDTDELVNGLLVDFKRKQKLSVIGIPAANSEVCLSDALYNLQLSFERVLNLLIETRIFAYMLLESLKDEIENVNEKTDSLCNALANTLSVHIDGILLVKLITNAFIVSDLPSSMVLKTNTKFTIGVKILLPEKMCTHFNYPKVDVSVIDEDGAKLIYSKRGGNYQDLTQHANELKFHGTIAPKSSQNLQKLNVGGRSYYGADFKDSKLDKIGNRKTQAKAQEVSTSTKPVAEKKYCFLFKTVFPVLNQCELTLITNSEPFILTVHGSQDMNSHLTIFGDYSFSPVVRIPFNVPEQVDWQHFCEALSAKWCTFSGCRRRFNERELEYFATKIFPEGSMPPKPHTAFNLSMVLKRDDDKMAFWPWFWCCMSTVAKVSQIKDLYDNETIMGFIPKAQCEQLLFRHPNNSLIIRFSDSAAGSLSYSFCGTTSTGQREVGHLNPWSPDEFKGFGVLDRFLDNDVFKMSRVDEIYPGRINRLNARTPTEQQQNSSDNKDAKGGYIVTRINIIASGLTNAVGPASHHVGGMRGGGSNGASCSTSVTTNHIPQGQQLQAGPSNHQGGTGHPSSQSYIDQQQQSPAGSIITGIDLGDGAKYDEHEIQQIGAAVGTALGPPSSMIPIMTSPISYSTTMDSNQMDYINSASTSTGGYTPTYPGAQAIPVSPPPQLLNGFINGQQHQHFTTMNNFGHDGSSSTNFMNGH